MQLHTAGNYAQDRYNFLKDVEGLSLRVYRDTDRIATIGIGINLRVQSHLTLVLQTLNFDTTGAVLAGSALTAEQGYITQLRNAATDTYADDLAVQAAFDAILASRFQDSAYAGYPTFNRITTFQFDTETNAKAVFDTVMAGYTAGGVTFTGYETQLDNWLASNSIAAIGPSKERTALVSLTFNNAGALLGPKLAAALKNNDRAEAWYEIRYNSNADVVNAKRRFYEADTFGIYDNGITNVTNMTDAAAKGAFRTYTRHKPTIDNYESAYSTALNNAIIEFAGTVQTRQAWQQPARVYLYDTYIAQKGLSITLNGDILVGEDATTAYYRGTDNDTNLTGSFRNDLILGGSGNDNLYGQGGRDVLYGEAGRDYLAGGDWNDQLDGGVDNDFLEGNSGADTLQGGAGDDVIVGGTENDDLYGGTGFDVYIYNTGDGYDRIRDDDGNGRLIFDDALVTTDSLQSGALQGVLDGTSLVINNTVEILNFSDGVLGIYFTNPGDDPAGNGGYPANDPNSPDKLNDLGLPPNVPFDPKNQDRSALERARNAFNAATTATPPRRADPLTLDLDGDGLETLGVSAGAYFDHDASGFAEQTGWIGADDGLLVWDRNGDGRINNGGELFGDQTRLQNGTLAANGFEALAEWDTNLDGKIDLNDSVWTNLKVWQDADGDGYSAASELKNLADVGVVAINLGYTNTSIPDGKGNTQVQAGSFTKADGSTGQAGGFLFNRDTLYTIQEDYLAVTPDIALLPDLRGYGNVYDLQQAMVRDATGSLKILVQNFSTETNLGARDALLDQILFKWTGSDGIDPASRGGSFDARKLAVLEKFYGRDFVSPFGPNPITQAATLLNQSYQGVSELFYAQLLAQTHFKPLYDQITYSWDTATQSIRGDLGAVTASLQAQLVADPKAGRLLLSEFARTVKGLSAQQTLGYTAFRDGFAAQSAELGLIIDAAGPNTYHGTTGNDNLSLPGANYVIWADAGDDVIALPATRNGAGDPSQHNLFYGGAGNDRFDSGASTDTYVFNRGDGADIVNDYGWVSSSALDTIAFGAGISLGDLTIGRSGDNLVVYVNDPANPAADDRISIENWYASPVYIVEGFTFADGTVWLTDSLNPFLSLNGTEGDDTLNSSVANNTLNGYGGNDSITDSGGDNTIDGGSGDDTIAINGPGANTVYGGDGNDTVQVSFDSDTIFDGGAGDDYLLVHRTGGSSLHHNTFIGGLGNDQLFGGASADTYYFDRGDGQDIVNDHDYGAQGATDTIVFGAGITQSNLTLNRSGDHLVIKIADPNNPAINDQVTIQWWYADPRQRIERFVFADGATLNSADVDVLPVTVIGTEAADGLVGGAGNDTLNGYGSNDILTDVVGNNILDGGDGDDTLTAGAGNDTFLGGAGADGITDTGGNNTIDGGTGNDTIRISGPGTNFLDGGDGDDTITTVNNANSTFLGGAGDDYLLVDRDGGSPLTANTFIGGTGNDYLLGTASTDTYIFNRGDGADTVNDHDYGAQGATDTIAFGAGISLLDLVFSRNGDHLKLSVYGSTDSINIQWWYADPRHHIERFTFADGSVLSDIQIEERINDSPTVVNPIADRVTAEDAPWTFVVPADTFSDADFNVGDFLSYTATLSDGSLLPGWLGFDPATRTFTATPANSAVGGIDITVTATDRGGLSISDTFTLTVTNVNDAPVVANPIPDQNGAEGSAFSYTVPIGTFSDIDIGDNLTYTAMLADGSALPAWLGFNSSTRTFGGTPTDGNAGSLNLRVTATDASGVSVFDDFVLTVADTIATVRTGTAANDVLNGTAWMDILQGLGGNDTLYGYAGNDTLDGGSGSDTMVGGLGNDTYVVNANGDVVTENINEGTDTVNSSITYTLGNNVENLTLTGTSAINATGNTLNNILIGNSANNTLTGNAGDDYLDGGTGSDTMRGGTGNDSYVVNSTGDIVTENANEGTDTVNSSITYTLGSNVENLTLTGASNINGTGNSLNNVLTGNAAVNILTGNAGADTLDGGAGNDTLVGGAGNDTYRFNRGYGADVIQENDSTVGNSDTATLGVDRLNIVFARSGNDLVMSLHGGTDTLTVQSWYSGAANQTETIRSSEGSTLANTQVAQLIQAMATFSVQNGGISWDQAIDQRPDDVQAVLAANWMPAA